MFDHEIQRATIAASLVVLGDSSEASSEIRIHGGHADIYHPPGVLHKRNLQSAFSFDTAWDEEETILHLE